MKKAFTLKRAGVIQPENGNVYFNIGAIFKDLKDNKRDGTIVLKPKYAEALANLGSLLLENGELVDAEYQLRDSIKIDGNFSEAYNSLGNLLGDFKAAKISFEKAIEIQPDHAEALNNLGNIYQNIGMLHKAIKVYKYSIIIDGSSADAYYNLGNNLWELGDIEQAEENFRQAIDLQPKFSEAVFNLGLLYHSVKNYEKAAEQFF